MSDTLTTEQAGVTAPVVPGSGALRPIGLDQVRITGGFWAALQNLNHDAIIPHVAEWDERVGWIANFDAVADGTIAERRQGREFSDSEIYKIVEALAWEVARTGSATLDHLLVTIVARIAAAQQEDGYLNTRFGNPGQSPRYTDLEWGHELYCCGHLIQAGVARLRSGRRDQLIDVAIRAADHVCDAFGVNGNQGVCGHPEIEVALVELYRATGDRRYLTQATLFLDRRGRGTLAEIELGQSYFQDDVPIVEADVLRGHAVRALYLSAGAIDAGVENDDTTYVAAVERQYRRALERRTYLTGGMGSRHDGEAFGDDFELPPDRAYCETCASIASIMVSWRLLLTTGDLSYADVIERTLYNVVATSPRGDGKAFFYANPLQLRVAATEVAEAGQNPRAYAHVRSPFFAVSCCPPNVARTLAQLSSYVATQDADGVQLLQYMTGTVRTALGSERNVQLEIETRYPDDGEIVVAVIEAPSTPWSLTLRIPAWADGASIEVSGQVATAEAPSHVVHGLRAGDSVILRLPMRPRWTYPDPRIDAIRGCVAVERGPLVLCAESVDLPVGVELDAVRVDPSQPPRASGDGALVSAVEIGLPELDTWPYGAPPPLPIGQPVPLTLIPYFRWANRGPSAMRVWLPTND